MAVRQQGLEKSYRVEDQPYRGQDPPGPGQHIHHYHYYYHYHHHYYCINIFYSLGEQLCRAAGHHLPDPRPGGRHPRPQPRRLRSGDDQGPAVRRPLRRRRLREVRRPVLSERGAQDGAGGGGECRAHTGDYIIIMLLPSLSCYYHHYHVSTVIFMLLPSLSFYYHHYYDIRASSPPRRRRRRRF